MLSVEQQEWRIEAFFIFAYKLIYGLTDLDFSWISGRTLLDWD